ncbi:TetR/AcrR family transcriptional regulator [Blastococcus sp. TF02A-30]|nr:TetR/AcrR family transcriptional regulator [Blastococcus sp. TF02A-30]
MLTRRREGAVEITDQRMTRRQAELLDQLEELFLAEGFARFTLEDLALRLHCSKSTLYALAGSKEQLALRVIRHFFRKATDAVEAQTLTEADPARRVVAYLTAVAGALAPAGPAFHRDLEAFAPGREVYERNTALAAGRVRELIADGVAQGLFREVHPALVADTVTTLMLRIGRGDTGRATGLDDAAAYRELALLLLHGIDRRGARA